MDKADVNSGRRLSLRFLFYQNIPLTLTTSIKATITLNTVKHTSQKPISRARFLG